MRKILWLAIILTICTCFMTGCSLPKVTLFGDKQEPLKEYVLQGTGKGKVLVLSVDGTISSRAEKGVLQSRPSMVQQIVAYLKHAEQDPDIKALLLKVNSPGGTVTASDILYHEISAYKQRTGVKIIVAMMSVAASGGYYISLPADYIVAHPTTITGSIGVIFLRPGVSGLMEKAGLSVAVNKSGAQKDMGSPYRAPTEEEVVLFQELTDTMATRFMDLVMKHRKLSPEQKAQISTARVYLADQAKSLGLVDQVGYLDDAVAKAKELAGMETDAKVICYRRYKLEEDTIYNPAIQHQGGELESMLPILAPLNAAAEAGFYYIWPAAMGY
ncbi:MAG: signal peptide peptidase SppA [Desulfobacteraceae bacterium]|nr:signal peptide peptidase SppA [Desulfobacteraceae bacterium]